MQELRLVAVSEDGSYAVLVVPGRSGRFALPIDERLRTVARGQFSRLAQYEIEVESPLRPKEIQDRIRAGETAEDIADAAGLPVDRIRRFEGPVLAEREYRANEARRATVRSRGDSGPGPRLDEIVAERLADFGASTDDLDWDSRKRQDGNWQVQLAYTVAGRMYVAEWIYDPRSKHVTPDDDEAIRLCLSEVEWPEPRRLAKNETTATVTPIGSRAGSHQTEHRPQHDQGAGSGISHPSRQAPAGVSAASAQPQRGRPARLPAKADEAVQVPAAAVVVDQEIEQARAAAGAGRADEDSQGIAKPAVAQSGRPARRGSGRSRRSSVPSWDEIMFGNSREHE